MICGPPFRLVVSAASRLRLEDGVGARASWVYECTLAAAIFFTRTTSLFFFLCSI